MPNRIILTGGGTAGHVMPNLALLPYLKAEFDEIHYIASEGGMECEILKDIPDLILHKIPCTKLIRSLNPKNITMPIKLIKSINAAKKLIETINPDIIFSKGGYVSLPVCLGAKNVPVILHESDLNLGLANKLSLKKCTRLLTSFKLENPPKNASHTGAPLRRELYSGDKEKAKRICGLYAPLPYLLITGGSQGAKSINNAVYDTLDTLTKKYNVIHIVGKKNTDGKTLKNYYQTGFTSNMADFLALADYAVTRGGANTLFELVSLEITSLIIPLSRAESRGDQILNAEYFSALGCSKVLLSENLSAQTLLTSLIDLERDSCVLKSNMKKAENIDGTVKIAKIILESATKNFVEK